MVRAPIRAGLVTVMVAPGTTAFVLSVTVPTMAPVVPVTWALTPPEVDTISASRLAHIAKRLGWNTTVSSQGRIDNWLA